MCLQKIACTDKREDRGVKLFKMIEGFDWLLKLGQRRRKLVRASVKYGSHVSCYQSPDKLDYVLVTYYTYGYQTRF